MQLPHFLPHSNHLTTTIASNHTSNNVDVIPLDPQPPQRTKKPPPPQLTPPPYKPMHIKNELTHGKGDLPSHINACSPYNIFTLFFTNQILQTLAEHTNKNAAIALGRLKQKAPYTQD